MTNGIKANNHLTHVLSVGLYKGKGSRGGIVHFNRLLLKHLDKKKFITSYFSLGKSPTWYEGEDCPSRSKYYVMQIKKVIDFAFEIKKKEIDIVNINSNLTQVSLFRDGIFSIIAKLSDCKTCFLIHGWENKDYYKILKGPIRRFFFSRLLRKQDTIGVLSNDFKNKLVMLSVDPNIIFFFSTMVEIRKFQPLEKNFNSGSFSILFCAHPLHKKKGIYNLLQAIPLVINTNPKTKFIILGSGGELSILKEESKQLEISKHIEFMGYITGEKKINIFKNSHILIFPSYTEGFPSTVLEAMAAGMPIVATPVGALADIIENKKQGLVIESMPPKPEEIADKINELIKNPILMKELSQNNLKETKEKYDVKVVINNIQEVYEKILEYRHK